MSVKNRLIGDRQFYKMVLSVAVPMMIQNGISNLVNLLDNVMVGQLGTESVSGVAIANQLFFVYMLCIFGGLSGAGIFTAQYFGQKDDEGVRYTFRYKFFLAMIIAAAAICLFVFAGRQLLASYLTGEGDTQTALAHGRTYLNIILIGMPAFSLAQAYATTLRECGETVVPMKAGVASVLVNLVFNYLLIYGKFGFPALGVAGAAIATVLARYVELGVVLIWSHTHTEKMPFMRGLYRSLRIPGTLFKRIIIKGSPLLFNEFLWSSGMAILLQCYSVRGLDAVAGMNISTTISNLFNIVFFALGNSVAIIVGQQLGANELERARTTAPRMIAFCVMGAVATAILMILFAPLFPQLYNTSAHSKELATQLLIVASLFMPTQAFLHSTYFTLRSGGKTMITFLFDSGFIWVVSIPVAYVLSHFTGLPLPAVYAIVTACDISKCIIGFILVKKGVWIQNIVEKG